MIIYSDPLTPFYWTVDGGWSEFGNWSECSAECDGGEQTRTKECNNPAPENGGADCVGEDFETQACNTHDCMGNLNSAICAIILQFNFWCPIKNPGLLEIMNFALLCQLASICKYWQYQTCPDELRVQVWTNSVDVYESIWNDWSQCSVECGGGEQTRTKECYNPPPEYGGADCDEEAFETRACNTDPCPGYWLISNFLIYRRGGIFTFTF